MEFSYKQLKQSGTTAENYPFTVTPDASNLGENPNLAAEVQNNYPSLIFGAAVLADGNVIIQDTKVDSPGESPWATYLTKGLNCFSTRTLQVVDAIEVNNDLNILINRSLPTNAVKLYVQGAGEDLMRLNSEDNDTKKVIKIKKKLTTRGPIISRVIIPEIKSTPEAIIVYDDVVASGWTAKKIASTIKQYYPNCPLYLTTWLMIKPNSEEPSGVRGYGKVVTSLLLQGNQMRRPPINSLSCLLENSYKGKSVRDRYRQYIQNIDDFNNILDQLRGGEII